MWLYFAMPAEWLRMPAPSATTQHEAAIRGSAGLDEVGNLSLEVTGATRSTPVGTDSAHANRLLGGRHRNEHLLGGWLTADESPDRRYENNVDLWSLRR